MILIDTNVLARSLQLNSVHNRAAIESMAHQKAVHNEVLVINPQSLVELYAISTRQVNGLAMSPDDAIREIGILKRDYELLPESHEIFGHWEYLVRKYKPRNRQVFNMRHVAFMIANKIPKILTFNDGDFVGCTEIEALNPFDVLGLARI